MRKTNQNSKTSWRRGALASGAGGVLCLCFFVILASTAMTMSGESHDNEPISPIPYKTMLDEKKVKLGEALFADDRLSGGNGISCSSCHLFERDLSDGIPIGGSLPGTNGTTRTLSLFNVGFNTKIGWAGQFLTLEQQALAVVEDQRRMGAKWDDVVASLRTDRVLSKTFNAIYKDGLKRDNVVDALVEYEKSLNTPNAPFDRYLRGDENAISQQTKDGYRLFKDYGCASCHQGVNVGGNMLQVFGIFGTPQAAVKGPKTPGSAQGTGIDDSRPVFRVPSLRNVAQRPPYFHDGSAPTLTDAIGKMAKYQLGRGVSDDDVAKIEAFLNSLSGEYHGVAVGKLSGAGDGHY